MFLSHYEAHVTAGYTPEKAEQLELSFLSGMSISGQGWYMETFQFFLAVRNQVTLSVHCGLKSIRRKQTARWLYQNTS